MYSLPELPYALDALSPMLSPETLRYHHGKHHRAYVKKLNELVKGTALDGKPIEDVVKASTGPLFDNGAQHYNHSFFWRCLKPAGSERGPQASLLQAIDGRFGSLSLFREDFILRAKELFGSGWCWLAVMPGGTLEILPLQNAGCPVAGSAHPLLVVDVWEHAYYIDYRSSRKSYLEAFWKLVDWDAVERRFRRSRQ